jgi:AbrB family looped-hinge helix DNA binding protein
MSATHSLTIDQAGRVVVPKSLRDELGLESGQRLTARVTDGRLELEPLPLEARLVERDGILVIEALELTTPMNRDQVREIIESVRR